MTVIEIRWKASGLGSFFWPSRGQIPSYVKTIMPCQTWGTGCRGTSPPAPSTAVSWDVPGEWQGTGWQLRGADSSQWTVASEKNRPTLFPGGIYYQQKEPLLSIARTAFCTLEYDLHGFHAHYPIWSPAESQECRSDMVSQLSSSAGREDEHSESSVTCPRSHSRGWPGHSRLWCRTQSTPSASSLWPSGWCQGSFRLAGQHPLGLQQTHSIPWISHRYIFWDCGDSLGKM